MNQHAIQLQEGQQPPYKQIYSLGPIELELLKTYIKTNLANGFIRPSKSPAGAPTLFVRKPDGSLRLYVNYRGLHNLIIQNWHPLSAISELLDQLSRAKRFTQLDLISAYYWMRNKEGDEGKTAFRTRYGLFKYQVMFFELSNALTSSQSYINKILTEKLDMFVIVYQDDIFIYIENPGQGHMETMRWVLDILKSYRLFTNLKKCRFHKDEVCFLGYYWPRQLG